MKIMGIDNGLDGALVMLDGGKPVVLLVMPTITLHGATKDHREYMVADLRYFLNLHRPDHVFIEKAHAMPKQGVSSMFTTGFGFGLMQGLIAGLELPFTIVQAVTWQKTFFTGMAKGKKEKGYTKGLAAIVCSRLWPGTEWRATDNCKKPHDGLCDAALIAEYGRRELGG
jgi:crossover junction endodeoxyribonuclease RuvC